MYSTRLDFNSGAIPPYNWLTGQPGEKLVSGLSQYGVSGKVRSCYARTLMPTCSSPAHKGLPGRYAWGGLAHRAQTRRCPMV